MFPTEVRVGGAQYEPQYLLGTLPVAQSGMYSLRQTSQPVNYDSWPQHPTMSLITS